MTATLRYTGERLIPDEFMLSSRIVLEHIYRYRFAAQIIRDHLGASAYNASILDAPCGAGYGSALLSEQLGAIVTGVDIDAETVAYATGRYASTPDLKLEFQQADIQAQVATILYDAVVCFEGIEHVNDQESTAKWLCESTRKGGLLFVSTPRVHGPGGGSEFHTKEMTMDEMVALFSPYLSDYRVYGQELKVGDSIADANARFYVLVGRR